MQLNGRYVYITISTKVSENEERTVMKWLKAQVRGALKTKTTAATEVFSEYKGDKYQWF